MNKVFRITVSLLLSAFILLGGSGLVIGKMVCFKSGHTVFGTGEMKDCCDRPGEEFAFQDQCCDISNLSFTQEHFEPQPNPVLKAPVMLLLPEISGFPSRIIGQQPGLSGNTFCGQPPGYSCSSAQAYLSVFRI